MTLLNARKAVWFWTMLLFFVLNMGECWGVEGEHGKFGRYPRVVSLNGMWDFQPVEGMSLSGIDPKTWAVVAVPAVGKLKEGHFGAYCRRFENPVRHEGERVFVHFQGVAFACEVYLNGRLVGRHGPTLEPFEVEVTPYLAAENELVVVVQDWTSGIDPQITQITRIKKNEKNKVRITDEFSPGHPSEEGLQYRTVSPMGGNYRLFGIWDDVWLEVVGDVRVEGLWVASEDGVVLVKGLTQRRKGANGQGKIEVVCEIADEQDRKVQAGTKVEDGNFKITLDASGLAFWEPGNPKMYRLVVEVPEYGYRKEVPFGYRVIRSKGHELYLNGKKVHLFTASIGPNFMPKQLTERLDKLKGLNINAVRFHGNVFPEWYYDVCDRMGMLVVSESPLYGSYVIQFDYESDEFFENAAIHWKGMVGKLRHHPSIVAYSIENECVMYSQGMRAEEKFEELGKKVKEWDGTRPILFNGGDDPGGAADIVSLHYPHELPFWNQYPMDAWDFLTPGETTLPSDPLRAGCGTLDGNRGTYLDSFWYHKPEFCWRWDRKKPLDLGEIGYFSGGKPHMDAILFGDWAYANPEKVRDRTRAEVWRESIDAGRASGVALMNPWNPPAGEVANRVLKEVLAPVRLVLYPDVWERYYGGSPVLWKGVLINDKRTAAGLALRFRVVDDEEAQVISGKLGPYPLEAGERQPVEIAFNAPRVFEKKRYAVQMEIVEDADVLGVTERPLVLYPPPREMDLKNLGMLSVFDPGGRLIGLLRRLDVSFEIRASVEAVGNEALVIGPEGLGFLSREGLRFLRDRIRMGNGSTLILAQHAYPQGLASGLTLNDRHGTSFGFVVAQNHPIFASPASLNFVDYAQRNCLTQRRTKGAKEWKARLEGIEDQDVRLWAWDGLISWKDFNIPVGGGYIPLIVGGGTGGLIYSPLIERQGLKGTTVFCQLPLVKKFWKEPVAAEILNRLLAYLGGENFEIPPLLTDLPVDLKRNLRDKGVEVSCVQGGIGERHLRMVRGGDLVNSREDLDALVAWIKQGNVLWVYGLEPSSMKHLGKLLPGITCLPLEETSLPVTVNRNMPLMDGILNQYLYWTESHGVFTYRLAKLLKPSEWVLQRLDCKGAYDWKSLTLPAVLMSAKLGKGRLVADTMNWAGVTGIRSATNNRVDSGEIEGKKAFHRVKVVTFDENQAMGIRLFSGLLTNLGVPVEATEGITIQAENMGVRTPGQPLIRNRNHHYWGIFTNSRLAQDFAIEEKKEKWLIEVRARCRLKLDEPPRMRVLVDGKTVGNCRVDAPEWRLYRVHAVMAPGEHELEIKLVNNPDDAYNYRYLHVDWIRISSNLFESQ